ncbi:DinB family protein [soil metagenome]
MDGLDFHRATLAWKCDGLSDVELRRRSMPPSSLSLLGLVRHMAEVERHWFRRVIAGETIRHVWSEDADFQAAYDVQGSGRDDAFTAWCSEIERSRRIEQHISTLDQTFLVEAWGCEASLRTVLLHLIHDYARHNGHADLLREGVDGTAGA